jgi:DNA-binding transcriptional regulator LsrR (DeoR family)
VIDDASRFEDVTGATPPAEGYVSPSGAKKGSKSSNRSPKTKDGEALEITLNYFNPFKEAQALKVVGRAAETSAKSTEEAEREMRRSATRGWRALRQAVAHKLVAVVPMPRPWLDEEWARKLRANFPDLLGVRVVNLDHITIKDARQLDDKVHEELGHAAAKWIEQGPLFQDNSVIGMGAGRGVFETVRCLQEFPALGARGVKVMSLTGWVHARNHAGTGSSELEADKHAAMMVQCFVHPTTVNMVNHPIAYEDDGLRQKIRERTHLAEKRWKDSHPRYALLGVGVLGPGHRLFEETNATRPEPGLQAIVEPLKELVAISESPEAKNLDCPEYLAVADVANQLFCVKGRNWVRITDAVRDRIEQLVEQINAKLLTITPAQLKDVENVILVAGTERKAVAIRHLLHTEQCNIRFLCTDKKTAIKILAKPF